MTQAVTVRRDGDSFQARMFWLKAAGLLDPAGPIAKVGFESGPGGFDDIWVEYDPPILDQEGKPLRREHIQCKWHVTPDSYGYMQVADPEFINANARSLLQRALAAQRGHAPQGEGARFQLVTNWRINREDPLRKLVNERSHTLRVDMLYASATDRSAMGQIRKFWREHLGIDERASVPRPHARFLRDGRFARSAAGAARPSLPPGGAASRPSRRERVYL
jgi:hypothetical protein